MLHCPRLTSLASATWPFQIQIQAAWYLTRTFRFVGKLSTIICFVVLLREIPSFTSASDRLLPVQDHRMILLLATTVHQASLMQGQSA